MAAIGWIWKLFMRNEGVNLPLADARFWKYMNDVQKWLSNIKRFEGTFGISEAIESVLVTYAVEKNIQFHDGIVIDSDMSENIKETIFYDADNYYFPEALLKKICEPLLDTISFLQLKQKCMRRWYISTFHLFMGTIWGVSKMTLAGIGI